MRLTLEQEIKRLEPAPVDRGREFTAKFANNAENISAIINSGSKAWNSIAMIYNSTIGKKNGTELPTISNQIKSKLDKFNEKTAEIEAQNRRKKAEKEASGEMSELDKAKAAAEYAEYINRQDKAAKEYEDRNSDVARTKADTERVDAENKNREAHRTAREHDRKDVREQQKVDEEKAAAKAKKAADKAQKAEEKAQKIRESSTDALRTRLFENTKGGIADKTRTSSWDRSTKNVDADIDYKKAETKGRSFVDSHGNILFTVHENIVSSRTQDRVKRFVDQYGNDLSAWNDE
jgi:hypothetical protein